MLARSALGLCRTAGFSSLLADSTDSFRYGFRARYALYSAAIPKTYHFQRVSTRSIEKVNLSLDLWVPRVSMTHKVSVDNNLAVQRRPLLKSIGLGLAGTALLTGPVGAVSAQSNEFSHELNEVRAATRKYRNVAKAREDGYATMVSSYVPNMGFHFVNPTLVAADASTPGDLTEPPILVYYTTGNYTPAPGDSHDPAHDDDLRLGGVEFAHAETGVHGNIFSDESASRSLKVSEEDGWGPIPESPLWALHVWVHRGNPAGMFHPTNPTIN